MENIGKRHRRPDSLIGVNLSMLFLCFLMCFQLVSAQPPFQNPTSASTTTLTLEVPIIETHEANTPFVFHVHVHNSSDLELLNHSIIQNCMIHLYTPEDGTHLIETNMTKDSNGLEWEFNVSAGNFTNPNRDYAVYFYCETNKSIENRNGYFEYGFYLTTDGSQPVNSGISIIYIVLISFILLFFGLALWAAIKIPGGNDLVINKDTITVKKVTPWKYFKLTAIGVSYGLFSWLITLVTAMTNNYLLFDPLLTMTKRLYLFVINLGYGVVVVIAIITFILIWRDIIFNEDIKKFGEHVISGSPR